MAKWPPRILFILVLFCVSSYAETVAEPGIDDSPIPVPDVEVEKVFGDEPKPEAPKPAEEDAMEDEEIKEEVEEKDDEDVEKEEEVQEDVAKEEEDKDEEVKVVEQNDPHFSRHYYSRSPSPIFIGLTGARQSTRQNKWSCRGPVTKCAANKAIDGNTHSNSVTFSQKNPNWSATLKRKARIDLIIITVSKYALPKFKNFKVETKNNGRWTLCKRYKMKYTKSVVRCNGQRIATDIRLTIDTGTGTDSLYLNEVEVIGYPSVNGGYSAWHRHGRCSAPCGGGRQKSHRYCNSPRPANGGSRCTGPSYKYEACNAKACPAIRLSNAHQSTRQDKYGCRGDNKCNANWAIDNNMRTTAVTYVQPNPKWNATLPFDTKIVTIVVDRPDGDWIQNKYKEFIVKTKIHKHWSWKLCKGPFHWDTPHYVIKCDRPTYARYIQLSVKGTESLYLKEVKVTGYKVGHRH